MATEIFKKAGKIVTVKELREFWDYGLADGSDVYVDKKTKIPVLKAGTEGTFACHWATFKKGDVPMADLFIPLQRVEIKPVQPPIKVQPTVQPQIQSAHGTTVQEIHNEDFLEFQRRTEYTTGKMDDRKTFVSLDTVRVHGDLANEQLIQNKLDKFFKHREYFEGKLKPKAVQ